MNRAWVAIPLIGVALAGCQTTEPEPVSQVPPPAFGAQPEPLPPVSINRGSTDGFDPSFGSGLSDLDAGVAPGGFEPEPLPLAEPVSRIYTVQKGDTFWSIAQREYGTGQKWRDISEANPSVDPRKLAVGQKITLP